MRVVNLLILLAIAGLVLPMTMAAGRFNLAILDVELGGYSLLEQTDFEEEFYISVIGGGVTGLSSSKTTWMRLLRQSLSWLPILPPPKFV